jgi:hypothetical protein
LRHAREAGIAPPAKYFAILAADGDRAGHWVDGRRNPHYRDLVHPDALARLERAQPGWLDLQRPSGPAGQAALATALSRFALNDVRELVEARYPGALIYAGGDDVLALVPLWNHQAQEGDPRHVLDLVDHLRRAFRTGFAADGGYGLGPGATISFALTVLHQSEPLAPRIRDTHHDLKHYAKQQLGRDALAISIVKRSGERQRAGLRFEPASGRPPLDLLAAIMDRLALNEGQRGLSPRLIRDLARAADGLDSLLAGEAKTPAGRLALDEIVRLAARHDRSDTATIIRELAAGVVALSRRLAPAPGDEPAVGPATRLVELLDAVAFIRREA